MTFEELDARYANGFVDAVVLSITLGWVTRHFPVSRAADLLRREIQTTT